MKTKIKVYIASPYTLGDVAVNVRNQIDAANELLALGYLPYTPLMCHFHHMIHPQPYDTWTMFSMEWLKICDAVLRLAGESKGAAAEVCMAYQLGIPVFTSLVELNKHFKVYS